MEKIKKIDTNILRLLAILILFTIVACITKPTNFMKLGNFQSMAKQLSEYGLMALGVGICMISGGIDLSTVYIANLTGIVAGLMMQRMAPESAGSGYIYVAMITALAIGTLCGIFNGVLVSRFRIPAMLATLGSSQLLMGVAIVISHGSTVSGIPAAYTGLGKVLIANVPLAFVLFLISTAVLTFVMSKSKFGQRVYLVGTNALAAKFAGIKNNRILIRTYMISGLLSALAGLISLARINSAKADFGTSYTMQTILIVVLGGVNPNGGFGSIPGIAIAVMILQMMSSYLNMFPNISNYYRDLIWGVALIAVLISNYIIHQQKAMKLSKIG